MGRLGSERHSVESNDFSRNPHWSDQLDCGNFPHRRNTRSKENEMFNVRGSTGLVLMAAIAGVTLSATAALAAPRPFSFRSVEYMPRDQREHLARVFVRENITPGMPMADALRAAKTAGAYCHPAAADGVVDCTSTSSEHHPGEHLSDVTWKVHIIPVNGAVQAASVTRTKGGF
ncbi:MAG: hypothetical protein ACYDD1_00120 [Caulobacteraceae bacterium]